MLSIIGPSNTVDMTCQICPGYFLCDELKETWYLRVSSFMIALIDNTERKEEISIGKAR